MQEVENPNLPPIYILLCSLRKGSSLSIFVKKKESNLRKREKHGNFVLKHTNYFFKGKNKEGYFVGVGNCHSLPNFLSHYSFGLKFVW